ncbi:MAG: hypothetical protein AAGI51_07035 [Pseudomonadota bacterium]
MRFALFAAMLMAGAAEAATVAVWRGAGPNACHGACPLEWAVDQLPEEQRRQVLEAMEAGGARPILVHRGDVFEFMTYQIDGSPRVDRRRTVAGMDSPARAWGWRFDGWSFVMLEECANWAPVVHAERVAPPRTPAAPVAAPAASAPIVLAVPPLIFGGFGSPSSISTPVFVDPTEVDAPPPTVAPPPIWDDLEDPSPRPFDPEPGPTPPSSTPPPPVAAIPLPQGAALLLVALGLVCSRSLLRRA